VAEGFCWSRGRPRKDADGYRVENAKEPCTAWINETLCKVIYVNLRLTVQYEIATGYPMNYLTDTFFPSLPPDENSSRSRSASTKKRWSPETSGLFRFPCDFRDGEIHQRVRWRW